VGALRAAGISPDQCERQEAGAGHEILILPSGLDMTSTAVAMLRAIGLIASQVDAASGPAIGVPVLAVLARGRIEFTGTAYECPGISAAANMLKSGILRGEIRKRKGASFAAMLSNDLYLQIYSQGYGLFDFNQFRPAKDPANPGISAASQYWLYTPEASADTGTTVTFGGASAAEARSRLAGAIPLAGMGALMLWHHSAQSHARDEHVVDPGRDHQDSHGRHHDGRHNAQGPGHSSHYDPAHAGTDHWIDHGLDNSGDHPDQHA
jgi:hypothetical protein